jgi:hypothetical protein
MYQRGVYYTGIKVFNSLPRAFKDISCKPDKFKTALRGYLAVLIEKQTFKIFAVL